MRQSTWTILLMALTVGLTPIQSSKAQDPSKGVEADEPTKASGTFEIVIDEDAPLREVTVT